MARSYNIEATRKGDKRGERQVSVGRADALIDELTEHGWHVVVKDAATDKVVSNQEINRRWVESDPADAADDLPDVPKIPVKKAEKLPTNLNAEHHAAKTQEAQSERFIAMARELGADESEERFNAKLKKVAGTNVSAEASDKGAASSNKSPKQ